MELLSRIQHVLSLRSDRSDRSRMHPGMMAIVLPVLWIGLVVAVTRATAEAQTKEAEALSTMEGTPDATDGNQDEQLNGVKIRESNSGVYLELMHPAKVSDKVLDLLRQAKQPVSLTIRADVEFSPDDDIPRLVAVRRLMSLSLDVPIEDRHIRQIAGLTELELSLIHI